MSRPADLNRGIRLAQDALARRLPRFETVLAEALRGLAGMVSRSLTDSLVAAGWSAAEPEALTAELRRRLDAAWVGRHTGSIERVRAEAWRVTVGEISAALGVSFDVTNPVLESAFAAVRNRTDLSETAWGMVRESLQESYDAGRGIPEASRDLRTRVAGMAPVRARTIARTEMIALSNAGSLTLARLADVGGWKTWLATADARTRDAHAKAAGQTVRIDDPFRVGGEDLDYPGDPRGSGGNVINCRCTTLFGDSPEGYTGPMGSSALLAAAGVCTCST